MSTIVGELRNAPVYPLQPFPTSFAAQSESAPRCKRGAGSNLEVDYYPNAMRAV